MVSGLILLLDRSIKPGDVIEIDGASNRGIEEIRNLREQIKFTPMNCTYKVVIIDEAHNFVSRIVNKLKSKKTKSLSVKLYEYIMDAIDCRVVFLTGTPMINYPNEIGILFNMLRGSLLIFDFTVKYDKDETELQKRRRASVVCSSVLV